ncbi:MAG: hypothetical protein WBL52_07860 [Bacillota bacterium]|nr:hypothetical protein [Candidatus Fermentithermobacillaceae bacterium]HOA71544.1 hypothetical protein [Bacillota bacterium]HOP70657.1 hypothetical protein [Bacillota bacterium]HPT36314.1 hypothetical protein [Bacillota bacterium]HPZ86057.1 hypothetical protein [Bacillota bacterium]
MRTPEKVVKIGLSRRVHSERLEKVLTAFVYALFPTSFAVFVSFVLARWGFKRMYYMAQLLPLCMVFYLTLAWFIYLRHEGAFWWLGRRKPPQSVLGHQESHLARDLPEDKVSGEELLHLRDESGLIFRRDTGPGSVSGEPPQPGPYRRAASPKQAIWILVWSACQLAILATVLYHWFGLGARFYN